MRSAFALLFIASILVAGCDSRQHKLNRLKAQYSKAHKQYYDDCVAPLYGSSGMNSYLNGTTPKAPSRQHQAEQETKCQAEAKRAGNLQQQLVAASK